MARASLKEKGSSRAREDRPFRIGCTRLFMEFAMNTMIETASGTAIQRSCVPTTKEPWIETLQEHFYKKRSFVLWQGTRLLVEMAVKMLR